jgi:very-short-patch-repair endonuclease
MVVEEFKIPGCRLKCDFLNFTKKIAIEVQGGQHFEFNKFFHSDRTGFQQHIKRDINKYDWLIANDFKVIELIEADIKHLSVEYIQEKFGIFIA